MTILIGFFEKQNYLIEVFQLLANFFYFEFNFSGKEN